MSDTYFQTNDQLSWKEIADQLKQHQPQSTNSQAVHINQVSNQKIDYEEFLDPEHGQLAIDIYETPSDLIVEAPIAGVKPEDLEVSIENDMLTIQGKRQRSAKVAKQDMIYQECHWGSFSRSIILPVDIINDRIDATLKNGVLIVRMPKAKKSRSIQVRSA